MALLSRPEGLRDLSREQLTGCDFWGGVATRLSLLLGTTFEMDALVPVARWDRLGFGRSWWRPLKHDVLPFRAATLRSDYLRSAIDGALDHS